MGAALLSSGKVYSGFNIENASFSLTLCAERTAAVRAILDGSRDFQKIAIVSDGKKLPFPCGPCRQFLKEFTDDMEVILVSGAGDSEEYKLTELLPEPFEF